MILDTNAVTAWAGGDAGLLAVLPRDRPWYLPVVVVGEFLYGLRRSRDRDTLEAWFRQVAASCVVLPVDAETPDHYASVREDLRARATPIPENDIWIAALARQHRLPVATRDRHFDQVPGLRRASWGKAA